MNDGPPWVTIRTACEITGVARRTIYNWLKAGRLQYRRTVGGSVRINPDSLWGNQSQGTPWEPSTDSGDREQKQKAQQAGVEARRMRLL